MNRKFKFRIWNIKYNDFYFLNFGEYQWDGGGYNREKTIYYWNSINANISEEPCKIKTSLFTDCFIQQFTGLLDKNGIEIYEGDILDIESKPSEVIWNNDMSCFIAKTKNIFYHGFYFFESKIIGNIFENPELLNNKKNNE